MPNGRYRPRTSFKDVDLLTCPDYEELSNVSRCLHLSDVEEARRRGMLVPQPIRNSRTLGSNTRVLWFAPTQSMEQHNFYGNVSYVINWKTVLAKMGPNLYLIDQAIYADHAYTRILLTKKNYDVLLQNVNFHSDGSAILKRSHNYVHAAKCYCKNRTGEHELQIGIEATEEDARWLYSHCTVMANNHTLANSLMLRQVFRKDGKVKKYAPFKCFLYNTTLNASCPYQDSRSEMEATLASKNISFSRSLPLDADLDADKENVNYNNRSYPAYGLAASTPSKIKPKKGGASSHAVYTLVPSSNQPIIINKTVPPHRPNKLPPISRTIVAPAANSGRALPCVERQHGTVRPLAAGSAYNSHLSYRTPPSPNPTFGHGRMSPNVLSARSSSIVPSPDYLPVRNDWGPIMDVVRIPVADGTAKEERPPVSFTDKLRRLFTCCC